VVRLIVGKGSFGKCRQSAGGVHQHDGAICGKCTKGGGLGEFPKFPKFFLYFYILYFYLCVRDIIVTHAQTFYSDGGRIITPLALVFHSSKRARHDSISFESKA
jgi:hypothetical protein